MVCCDNNIIIFISSEKMVIFKKVIFQIQARQIACQWTDEVCQVQHRGPERGIERERGGGREN